MTSLREIKDKLDALDAKVSTFEPAMGKQLADVAGELIRLADSQGKLLATLNEHGTAFDIVCESQGKLLAALNELDAKVMATGNGLADEIRHLTAAVSYFAKSALRKKPQPKRKRTK